MYYWLDNGLLNANTAQYTGNNGLLLETVVYKELYLKFGSIYNNNIYCYTEASGECDFIIYPEGGTAIPIHVSWSLTDPDTRSREIKGLLKAATYCKVNKALIITLDEEEDLDIDGVNIQIIPAWKWMLRP
ncbi:DUF4143 domain-containing protein [Pedobacter psychrodurus]|uniref:DUF4143 domain-containing protein n=1 Tax=Pedobacter psychrodurus TaxID=2530456 RepID=UPI00292EA1D7|nr:DUF4143 domain-containing protein [Pedobacter psychrodurus]